MCGASGEDRANAILLLFSSRLGCLRSLPISAAATPGLALLSGRVRLPGW
jgi:hypothetical protein